MCGWVRVNVGREMGFGLGLLLGKVGLGFASV